MSAEGRIPPNVLVADFASGQGGQSGGQIGGQGGGQSGSLARLPLAARRGGWPE